MAESAPVKGTAFRWLAVAAAVALPAALSLLFWRTALAGRETGPAPAAPPSAAPVSAPSVTLDGAAVYRQNCAACHGADLKGSGTTPALLRDRWPYAERRELLIQIIHRGRGLTMPAFEGRLSNQQIEAVADYLNGRNAAR